MNTETIIAVLSLLIIASYFFSVLGRWMRLPSVLLLLATGIIIHEVLGVSPISDEVTRQLVRFLGVTGLVMIVLEASLDIKLSRSKIPIIRSAFFSASAILLFTGFLIALGFHLWFDVPWVSCLAYAIPLSIISSAIAIPSAEHLPASKREFVTYESSLSDILGILLFNFITLNDTIGAETIFGTLISVPAMLLASIIATLLLVWLTGRITTSIKFFLLLAILFLLYSVGKLFHLPSLLLVLIFGLMLNNIDLLIHPRTQAVFDFDAFAPIVSQFRSITAETAFLVRTFFFLLFGYSMALASLASIQVIVIGAIIVLVQIIVRGIYFSYFLRTNLFPEILIMPRGLITILLFFSIPEQLAIPQFDEGILFFVIVSTTLLMTSGLLFFKPPAN